MNEKITEFKDIPTKNIEISNISWKFKDGHEVRLMDMTQEELQKVYNHANDMLYNKNRYTPGKMTMKKNVQVLIKECNAELFKRYLLYDCNIDILKTPMDIINFLREFKKTNNVTDDDSVSTLFNGLPHEYQTVTIGLLFAACFDSLDVINRKMISDSFILAQGIWLTDAEKVELTEYIDGKARPWLEVIKERTLLPNTVKLRVSPKGFTYKEFRSLIHLAPLPKISSLPTDTLVLFRDKVFLLLDIDTDYHINKWETLKKNIEDVAEYKKITLTTKNYE